MIAHATDGLTLDRARMGDVAGFITDLLTAAKLANRIAVVLAHTRGMTGADFRRWAAANAGALRQARGSIDAALEVVAGVAGPAMAPPRSPSAEAAAERIDAGAPLLKLGPAGENERHPCGLCGRRLVDKAGELCLLCRGLEA